MEVSNQITYLTRRNLLLSGGCVALAGCETVSDSYRNIFGPVSLDFENSDQFLANVSILQDKYEFTSITEHAVRFYTFMKWREATENSELRSVDPSLYLDFIDGLHLLNVELIEQQNLAIVPNSDCIDSKSLLRLIEVSGRTMFVTRGACPDTLA